MQDTTKLKSREAFAATLGTENAYTDDNHTFFAKAFIDVVRNGSADFANSGFMTIQGVATAMEPQLGLLLKRKGRDWNPTAPVELNEAAFPGSFSYDHFLTTFRG